MTVFRGANPFDHLPPAVKNLLIFNLIVYLIQMIFPSAVVGLFALTPVLVLKKFWVWQLVSYSFLHGNFWHLFFNMFALWMFGPHVEQGLGTRVFLRLYFTCVVAAAVTQFFIAPTSLVVGASGGIYGVLLAFGFLYPNAVIYLFFVFPMRAIQAVFLIGLITLVFAVQSGGSHIAHFAHLGGMFAGFVFLKYPVWKENFRLWRASRLFQNPRGRKRRPKTHPEVHDLTEDVDKILDKISAQGIESLTAEEQEIMERYARRKS